MIWVYVIGIYAVLVTAFYVLLLRQYSPRISPLLGRISPILEDKETPPERLKVHVELLSAINLFIPWYERCLSATGIAAFFGMSLAAAVQTINATSASVSLETTKRELSALEETRTSALSVLEMATGEILSRASTAAPASDAEARILELRSKNLESLNSYDRAQLRELFSIYMVLGKYDAASALVESHRDDFVEIRDAADEVTLAEFNLINGNYGAAKETFNILNRDFSGLPRTLKARLLIVGGSLFMADRTEFDSICRQYASLKSISIDSARRKLLLSSKRIADYRNSLSGEH